MADDVQVVFGAQVAGLLAGVAEATGAIEGLRAPIAAVQGAFAEFAEVAGITYAIEKVREFATEMAELGEKTLNTANLLGLSVQDLAQLQGVMTLVGADADTAQRTLERLALSAQRVAEGSKTAIAAFHNLGISTAEVNAHSNNLVGLLQLVIERFNQLEPSARNVAIAHELVGRGVDRLAALFRLTPQQYEELIHATDEYVDSVSRSVLAEDASAEAINKLTLDVKTLANDGFLLLKPAVDIVVEAIDQVVNAFDAAAKAVREFALDNIASIRTFVGQFVNGIRNIIDIFKIFGDTLNLIKTETESWGMSLHAIFVGILAELKAVWHRDLDELTNAYDRMWGELAAITNSRGAQIIAQWDNIAGSINSIITRLGSGVPSPDLPDVFQTWGMPGPTTGGRAAGTERGGGARKKASDDRMQEWREELRERLQAEGNFFNDSKREELQYWQEKLALVKSNSKEDVKLRREVNAEIFNLQKSLAREGESDAIQEQNSAQRLAKQTLDYRKTYYEGLQQQGLMTAVELAQTERQLREEEWAADQEFYQKKLEAAKNDTRETKKLQEQQAIDYEKYATDILRLDNKLRQEQKKALENQLKDFTEFFNSVGQQFSAFISGITTKQETMRSAFKKLFDSILQDFEKLLGDMLTKLAATGLAKIAGGAVQTAVTSAQEAGGTGLGAAFTALLGRIFPFLVTQQATMSTGFASVVSELTTTNILLSSLVAKPSFAGFQYEMGGIVPAAQHGWVVPSFQGGGMLSMVHANEMVLPADISSGLQSAIRGGGLGGGHTFNIQAWDHRDVARWVRANPAVFAAGANHASRMGYAPRTQ